MTDQQTAAFLVIGNEILSGRTKEGNLPVLAEGLGARGIAVREVRVVPDVEAHIIAALDDLRAAYELVFTSGGLGPTHDDITAGSIAKAFGVSLRRHPDALAALASHYERLDVEFNEARRSMADVPEGATLVPNRISAAPGFLIGNVYAFAGVPDIFRAMLGEVLPTLAQGAAMHSRALRTGLPEGIVAEPLRALQARHETVDMGSYPRFDHNRWATTLVLRSADIPALDAAFDDVVTLVRACGGTPEEE